MKAGTGTTTIKGGGRVSISGGGKSSVFVVDSGAQAVLTGLTIDNGLASNKASYRRHWTLVGGKLTLDSGVAYTGGGIDNTGTLLVSNTTIANNSAINTVASGDAFGGGICNSGTANLTDVTIANNSAVGPAWGSGDGGGIYNTGKMTVTDCTFSGNTASAKGTTSPSSAEGGAIFNDGTLSLTATTVSGNVAYSGGGIANYAPATLTLADTIVAGNTLNLPTGTGPDILGSVVATSAYNLVGVATGFSGIHG